MILDATSETFGFTIDELKGPNRRRPLVTARQIEHVRVPGAHRLQLSGHRPRVRGPDHTTVMHAVEKIGNLMKERHQIYNQVTELILRIKSAA